MKAALRRLAAVSLGLALPGPGAGALAAQASSWRAVETVDELTGARDVRLILRSTNWPSLERQASDREGATLIVACGERLPSDSGRTLLFYAGEPLMAFGQESGYAEFRFAAEKKTVKPEMRILDYGDAMVPPTGQRATRYIAFLGALRSPYYSTPLFKALLTAGTVEVTYTSFSSGQRKVSFNLSGLRESLTKLKPCSWPLD